MSRKNTHLDGLTRRAFGKLLAGVWSGIGGLLSACSARMSGRREGKTQLAPDLFCPATSLGQDDFEYVVVGSGAGGGPLAANLARSGRRVLLLEAGGDDEPYNYKVPAFHANASEDDRMKWDFFVRHYGDDEMQKRDEKFVEDRDGVLYPRAGTLGGCTAHHALITVCPHNGDWDHISEITGDSSWRADNMRKYFERLERCQYVQPPRDPADPRQNPGRHGFSGWLVTNLADPRLLLEDGDLLKLVKAALKETFKELGKPISRLLIRLKSHMDPNDWRLVKRGSEGVSATPLSTNHGRRTGPREYIRRVQEECPHHFSVKTGALVTRVLFDDTNRAVGVECLEGRHLYRADPQADPGGHSGVARRVRVSREVILSGGAFNTPQLLKLSGIGPRAELEKNGIETRVDLPGVGKNLQDRYEVGVVTEMKKDFELLKGATLKAPGPGQEPDPQFRRWLSGEGPYTTNGAVISVIKRSAPSRPDPDLFIFGLAGFFKGYFPGYSEQLARDRNFFTWAILKAHTRNTAGTVTLRSSDPRDTPLINFRYFGEGSDAQGEDLDSVVEGVEYARRINQRSSDIIEKEVLPGPQVRTPDQIRKFIRENAWGHHASCTCKIGPREDEGVVDGDFRVHGTSHLRVVDASVFPRIPGFFIVSAIFMISEKASDVILADAREG